MTITYTAGKITAAGKQVITRHIGVKNVSDIRPVAVVEPAHVPNLMARLEPGFAPEGEWDNTRDQWEEIAPDMLAIAGPFQPAVYTIAPEGIDPLSGERRKGRNLMLTADQMERVYKMLSEAARGQF